MQIDPYNAEIIRLPDGVDTTTMTFQSVDVFELPVFFNGDSTDGSFSAMFQPTLGGLDEVDQYATAIVKYDNGKPASYTSSDAYWGAVESGNGIDPRISQYYGQLTQPQTALLYLVGADWSGGNNSPLGLNPTTSLSSYGLGGAHQVAASFTTTELLMPPGQYIVSVEMDRAAGALQPLSVTTDTGNVTTYYNQVSTDGTLYSGQILFSQPKNAKLILSCNGAAPAPDSSIVQVMPTFTPAAPAVPNYGDIQQIRPLAMSALVTSMVPTLLEGGMVASAYLPGETADEQYFTDVSNQAIGDLHTWEALAKLPNAYSGKWKDGTYAWWSYEDVDDWQFYSPSKALNNAFPTIAIAGQLVPQSVTGAPPTKIPAVRVVITRIFECQTVVRLYELQRQMGLNSEFEMAMQLLALQPKCMMNDEHRSFVRRVLDKVKSAVGSARQFFDNNRSWIVPLATTAAGLL